MADESGQKLPHLYETADGRKWSVELFGMGQRVKVTDIMSPTGYHEWVGADQVGVTWLRAAQSLTGTKELDEKPHGKNG